MSLIFSSTKKQKILKSACTESTYLFICIQEKYSSRDTIPLTINLAVMKEISGEKTKRDVVIKHLNIAKKTPVPLLIRGTCLTTTYSIIFPRC